MLRDVAECLCNVRRSYEYEDTLILIQILNLILIQILNQLSYVIVPDERFIGTIACHDTGRQLIASESTEL